MIHRATRRSLDDGAIETLTIVRREDGSLAVQIEAGTPAGKEQDFVGLYHVDGARIDASGSWEIADGVSDEEADEIFDSWESGNTVVERWTPERAA